METSNHEVTRKRILRGSILKLLLISPNAPMPVSTIELALLTDYPQITTELALQINWLIDRKYILVTDEGGPGSGPSRGMKVRITDTGQDVMDGSAPDIGVIPPRG